MTCEGLGCSYTQRSMSACGRFVKMRPHITHSLHLAHCLIAATAAALGSGYLHPAPLVAHIEIRFFALELSSAPHRHLAAWQHRSIQIQDNGRHRLPRAQA